MDRAQLLGLEEAKFQHSGSVRKFYMPENPRFEMVLPSEGYYRPVSLDPDIEIKKLRGFGHTGTHGVITVLKIHGKKYAFRVGNTVERRQDGSQVFYEVDGKRKTNTVFINLQTTKYVSGRNDEKHLNLNLQDYEIRDIKDPITNIIMEYLCVYGAGKLGVVSKITIHESEPILIKNWDIVQND